MSKYLDDVGVKYLWDKTKSHVEERVSGLEDKIDTPIEIPTLTTEEIDKLLTED